MTLAQPPPCDLLVDRESDRTADPIPIEALAAVTGGGFDATQFENAETFGFGSLVGVEVATQQAKKALAKDGVGMFRSFLRRAPTVRGVAGAVVGALAFEGLWALQHAGLKGVNHLLGSSAAKT